MNEEGKKIWRNVLMNEVEKKRWAVIRCKKLDFNYKIDDRTAIEIIEQHEMWEEIGEPNPKDDKPL